MMDARTWPGIEIRVSDEPVAYPDALAVMDARAAEVAAGDAPEMLWLLEHPSLYTAGTSAKGEDLLDSARFPVFRTGRGGQFTYHGPGQIVGYVMLNVAARSGGSPDVRGFVRQLEEWLIRTLARFGIAGERRAGRVGIWVAREGGREDKVAALGIRIRRGVSLHGVSLNLDPDLSHFSGIVPCGISAYGVTSMAELGRAVTAAELRQGMIESFAEVFSESAQSSAARPVATPRTDQGESG
jgi:lipoyl(octanoyl) transferase